MMNEEDRYKRLFEMSIDLLCIANDEGYFIEANHAWEKVTGYSVAEIKAKPFMDFVHPDDRTRTLKQFEDQRGGLSAISFQNRYLCKDGSYKWLEWVATPMSHERLVFATARDITERQQLDTQLKEYSRRLEELVSFRTAKLEGMQQQLLHSQKMEAIGRLAGGIAHDFNNALTVILGSAEIMLSEMALDDPLRSDTEGIRKAGNHAATLTKQLLAFSRKQVMQLQPLQLNELITDMAAMIRRLIGENIEVTLKLHPELGWIQSDKGQLEQVFINLVVNARDAMPNGGKLLIETSNVELGEDYVKAYPDVPPGYYTMLAITDSGEGMSEETKSRIFEPFFTTKSNNKGSGLGLATVFGIIKQCMGNIWVYSELGHGTTFKIYLPRIDTPDEIQIKDVPVPLQMSGKTILVVEDEQMVRNVISRALTRAGFRVLETGDAQEALALCELHSVDLLLTDVLMPNMSGPDLAEKMVQHFPHLRVMFMSGYTENMISHKGILNPDIHFIEKPFESKQLIKKIEQILKVK